MKKTLYNFFPMLMVVLLFLTCGCSKAQTPEPESEPAAATTETVTEPVAEPTAESATGSQDSFINWSIDDSDVVVDLDLTALYDPETQLYGLPGIPLGSTKEAVLEHFGVSRLEMWPPADPELWFTATIDGTELVFIPEFGFNSKYAQCSLYINDSLSNTINQQSEALVGLLEDAYGEADYSVMTGEDLGKDDSYSCQVYQYKQMLEEGFSALTLYLTQYQDDTMSEPEILEIQLLLYRKY